MQRGTLLAGPEFHIDAGIPLQIPGEILRAERRLRQFDVRKSRLANHAAGKFGRAGSIQRHRIGEAVFDFSGDQIVIEILPSKLTFALQIPLRENHGLKSDPYTVVMDQIKPENSGDLFFRLFPVMKGMPEEVENALFQVKIKPVLIDEGGFKLNIKYTDVSEQNDGGRKDILPSVIIDEVPVLNPDEMQLLMPGSHHLAVSAEKYRTEIRVFTVEQAKITELTVEMKDTAPTVVFAGPDNAEILLDGEKVDNPREVTKIKPGKHTVVFSVGDYKLQKQFTAEEGRDYSVSMTVDAEIMELE